MEMNINEFELRYLAYQWFSKKFDLGYSDEDIIKLVQKTDKGQPEKKLTEISVEELKELTKQTYSNYKKWYLVSNEWKKLKNFEFNEYVNRLEYELYVVNQMQYNSFCLIVQDFINWSRANWVWVWPGRWSAAWSLLLYFVGIVDLDPMDYDLIFERFLNPARVSMPDVDTDFEDVEREKVIKYVVEKYWYDNVSSIWTYMTMAARAAFKDVARVMGMKFGQSNEISAMINPKPWTKLEKALKENPQLLELYETNEQVKIIFDMAMKLEWNVRQIWVHACWIIISPVPTYKVTPVQFPPKDAKIVTMYDGHYLEDLGLLKMDFLGLRNLTIIKNTIKILRAKYKKENKPLPDFVQKFFETTRFDPPMNDQNVFETVFHPWDTSGVFQFESDWMRAWHKLLKANDINDLIALAALYRPWPMQFIPSYIARKNWEEKISYMHEDLANILRLKYWEDVVEQESKKLTQDLGTFMDITYWIPVYQEQLMRLVQAMAWFSLAEADMLRRWVWKKIKEVVEKIKIDFIEKSQSYRDYKPETADYIYEHYIMPAADYSFNKSHSACYAYISYQTAFLKTYFPIEFYAALLRSVEEDTEKMSKFLDECKIKGYKILPPDVNKAYAHFAAVDWDIVMWLLSIRWIWQDVAQHIEDERTKNGKYSSLENFFTRNKIYINKRTLESLTKAWALDSFEDRNTILNNIARILEWLKWWNEDDLFWAPVLILQKYSTKKMERLLQEFEVFKSFVTWHPFDWLYDFIKPKFNFLWMIQKEDFWDFNLLWIIKSINNWKKWWHFIIIEDISGEYEFYLKDKWSLEKFDVINIKWKKTKYIRISKITKFDLELFAQKAEKNWKLTDQSVAQVRNSRNDLQIIEYVDSNIQENLESNIEDFEQKNHEDETLVTKFSLPDDIKTLRSLKQIVVENPWDNEIYIWDKSVKVNESWKILLQNLLS